MPSGGDAEATGRRLEPSAEIVPAALLSGIFGGPA
jgi:hypothetical protein